MTEPTFRREAARSCSIRCCSVLIVSQPEFGELKELRLILEKNVVRLAILNATEDDLLQLRECVEKTQSLKDKAEKKYDELLALESRISRDSWKGRE